MEEILPYYLKKIVSQQNEQIQNLFVIQFVLMNIQHQKLLKKTELTSVFIEFRMGEY